MKYSKITIKPRSYPDMSTETNYVDQGHRTVHMENSFEIGQPKAADSRPFGLPSSLRLRVLGENASVVDCTLHKRSGNRMIVRLSSPVPPRTCVRIDFDGAMVLGEVLGAWRDGPSLFSAIELHHTVTRFGLVDPRFWSSPSVRAPREKSVRKRPDEKVVWRAEARSSSSSPSSNAAA